MSISALGPRQIINYNQTTSVYDGVTYYSLISSVHLADFNGDGRDDIFFAETRALGRDEMPVHLYLNNGSNQFYDATAAMFGTIPTAEYAARTITDDFNGDGKADVFIPDFGADYGVIDPAQNGLLLSTATGMSDVSATNLPQIEDQSHGASSGDIDGDGDVDILVNNLSGPYYVDLLINDGTGKFTRSDDHIPHVLKVHTSFGDAFFEDNSYGHTWSELIDVDGNGALDMVLGTNLTTNRPSEVYLNDGSGDFSGVMPIQLPRPSFSENVMDIEAFDFNADGYMDLAFGLTDTNYTETEIQILINNANQSFSDATSEYFPSANNEGYWPKYIQLTDWDVDGAAEIFTSILAQSGSPSSVGVLSNGQYADINLSGAANHQYSILAAGDLNNDGTPEFVSTLYNAIEMSQISVIKPTTPLITAQNKSFVEADNTDVSLSFKLDLSSATSTDLSLPYTVYEEGKSGTVLSSGTAMIAAGSTSTTISYSVASDVTPEALQTFVATFQLPSGARFVNGATELHVNAQLNDNDGYSWNPLAYLKANPDLVDARVTMNGALDHWVTSGSSEGRLLYFDTAAYIAANPDLVEAGLSESQALEHYKAFGVNENRPLSAEAYLAANPDLVSAGITADAAGAHYANFGRFEGRTPGFDAAGYLVANPDLVSAGYDTSEEAIVHWRAAGQLEGRPIFDPGQYFAANPDVASSGIDAYLHYNAFGRNEGRSITKLSVSSDSFGIEGIG